MKFKKQLVALMVVGLCLAGCSTTHHKAGANGSSEMAGSEQDDATTSGLGKNGSFSGENGKMSQEDLLKKTVFYFDFDKDVVHQEDVASVDAHARYLVAHPNAKILIEGNTDSRGSREYNIGLGWRRAEALARMIRMAGVKQSQIRVVSLGEERPAVLGHTEEAYRLNRRDQITYESR